MKNEEIAKDENKKEEKNESKDDSDNKLDLKELFFTHPSQRDKKKKDFTEYSRIDMKLLSKKRERDNNEDKEKDKDTLKDNNLSSELIELIKKAEDNGPFTAEDFDKYKTYKKINIINFNKINI